MELFDFSDVVKYVNHAVNPSEEYSVPKESKPIPKYLEIIYDADDNLPLPVRPYEIPLPPLTDAEMNHLSSETLSVKSDIKNTDLESSSLEANNTSSIKSRTLSNSSTVSETSVYNPPRKKELLNTSSDDNVISNVANSNENCKSNETLLLPPPPPHSAHAHDFNKRKLQQMYANTNIETAIRSCDGITSM